MTYPLESSNSSGGGDTLLIKGKVKFPAGKKLEIMTFRYLKTLVFDNFFKNYNIIWCFHFGRVLFVITNPFFMSLWLFDVGPLYTLIHFSKIDMTTKNSGGFIRFLPHPIVQGRGDDAIKYLVINGLGQLLFSSLLSILLLLMVFKFTAMDFIWIQEPPIFLRNEQNEKVQNCEELH